MTKRSSRGSARASTTHWWHQRLTAMALIPLGLWLALTLPAIELGSHSAVIAWLGEPQSAILLGLTAICLSYHSWLGVRVVLEDYVHGATASPVALLLCTLAHVVVLGACLFALLGIAFGSQ
jgi:succinate dehydrogenase / fumarate reductase membrane anchor subunit